MQEQHPEARFIIETLAKAGFVAYYAGGWVRDYLLNHPSDDIDIATNAPPETIQVLFPKTVPIGLAFGIILVLIGDKEFEVATFRNDIEYKDGRRPTKIEFTTAQEDAKRRDFTINGMFYDPLKEEIYDFVDGEKDLRLKTIRAIGNPHERIKEDRLRMIRAVRLSARFNFTIDEKTIEAIKAHATELFPAVAMERIWQELTKMKAFPGFKMALEMLYNLGLLSTIFPELKEVSKKELQERLSTLDNFPSDIPTIAYILELFPNYTLQERIELCKYLKLSNEEINFAVFLFESEQKKLTEKWEYAHFYAHPYSIYCIQIFAARLPIHDRPHYLQEQEKKIQELEQAILRIKNKKPVVTSQHLKEIGIQPGVKMGKLLKEAERIAINENLEDPKKVLEKLKF